MKKRIMISITVLAIFSLAFPAFADIPVRVTNTVRTQVVSEPTTPRNVNVVSEPNTTRNVSVVSEPVTPRDVSVINSVNVSANEPLPVSVQSGAINPSDYFVMQGHVPVGGILSITTVPQGKLLLVTDLILFSPQQATFYFGATTSPDTITDIRLTPEVYNNSTINLQTPVVFEAGQQVAVQSYGNGRINVVGKFVDA